MFIVLNFITVFWRKEGKDNRGQNEGSFILCMAPRLVKHYTVRVSYLQGQAGTRWEGWRGRDTSPTIPFGPILTFGAMFMFDMIKNSNQ